MVVLLLLLLSLLWQYSFFCCCSGTDSWLSLCGRDFSFFRASKERLYVLDSQESWLLQRFQHEILEFACMNTIFSFFFFHYLPFLCFSPCSRGKTSVFVAVRERLVFILSSFMVPICTILKVLILVYMQNIPVLQQKNMLQR